MATKKKFDNWNPEFEDLVGKTFDFKGDKVLIRHRIPTDKHTELFLWNITKCCYVSGLKRVSYQKFEFCLFGEIKVYTLEVKNGLIQYS